jgi:hypothetical protein
MIRFSPPTIKRTKQKTRSIPKGGIMLTSTKTRKKGPTISDLKNAQKRAVKSRRPVVEYRPFFEP